MKLDLQTEFYFAISALGVMAIGLLMLWWRDRSDSLRDWALALGVALMGNLTAGFYFRNIQAETALHGDSKADWIALAGLSLITVGYVFATRGMVRHFGGRWSGRLWWLLAASTLGFLCFMSPQHEALAWGAISCYTRAILCGYILASFLHHRRRVAPWAATLIVLPISLQGLYMFARGTVLVSGNAAWREMLSPQLTYLVATIATQAFVLGLVILHVEKLLTQLSNAANTDVLTGLHNRRSFNLLAAHQFEAARRQGFPFWLLMLDIDHFKSVNDRHGHDEGDRLLRDVGAVLRAAVRQSDIVARFGGEEFCIVASHADADQILLLASRLMAAVAEVRDGPGQDAGQITTSIGVACMQAEDSLAEMLKRADQALYQAKNTGRKKAVFYPGEAQGYEDWSVGAVAA